MHFSIFSIKLRCQIENHVTDYRQPKASGFHDIPAVLYLSLFVLQEKPLLQQYNTHLDLSW
jgi:hypothetical protein